MDELWSLYEKKASQVWLCRAIDHDTGDVVAFWFGTREHANLDKLISLMSPLDINDTASAFTFLRMYDKIKILTYKN